MANLPNMGGEPEIERTGVAEAATGHLADLYNAQPLGDLFGCQEFWGTGIQAHAVDRPMADDVAGLKSSSIGFVLLRRRGACFL